MRFGYKKIIGPRPLGVGAVGRVRPPPLDPLVLLNMTGTLLCKMQCSIYFEIIRSTGSAMYLILTGQTNRGAWSIGLQLINI